jgi:hypothetical protein
MLLMVRAVPILMRYCLILSRRPIVAHRRIFVRGLHCLPPCRTILIGLVLMARRVVARCRNDHLRECRRARKGRNEGENIIDPHSEFLLFFQSCNASSDDLGPPDVQIMAVKRHPIFVFVFSPVQGELLG